MRFLQPFISQRFHHPYVSTNPFLSLFQTHLTPNAPVLVKLSIQTRYSSTLKVQPATVKSSSSHSRLTVDEAVSFIKSHHTDRVPRFYQTCIKCVPIPISQPIQRTIILPHSCTKKIKILCFAEGKAADAAKAAGAHIVGGHDLIPLLTNKELEFDLVLSTPEAFNMVKSVAKILGPMGLMPSLKKGTVLTDLAEKIEALNAAATYTCTRRGDVMMVIGLATNTSMEIKENIQYILTDLVQTLKDIPNIKNRPKQYISKVWLTAQTSPAFPLSLSEFELPSK